MNQLWVNFESTLKAFYTAQISHCFFYSLHIEEKLWRKLKQRLMSGREKLSEVKAEEELAPKKQKFYLLGSIAVLLAVAACTGIVPCCNQIAEFQLENFAIYLQS